MENHSNSNQLQNKPNNNMILSIVSMLLGCLSPLWIGFILGLIAVVFSVQVNFRLDSQNYEGAIKAAKISKILSFIAIGLALVNILWIATHFDQYKAIIDEMMHKMNQK